MTAHAQPEHAASPPQTQPDALASARKLFTEALRAEEKGNFAEALEKFRRVAKVRDTVPVRYRIGACLEGLGQLKDALQAYQSVIDLGAGDAKDLDVVRAAKEQSSTLNERIPQLTLTLSSADARVPDISIDGTPISSGELGKPIALEPGAHQVSASAPGAEPFQTQITLNERARLSLVVQIPDAHAAPPAPPPAPGPGDPPPPPSVSPDRSRTTGGWITLGAGAAFLVGAGVTLALRESAISSLDDACPSGACPRSRENELSSTRSRAQAEGPIAAVFAGLGVVGVGIGTYLLLTSHRAPAASAVSASRKDALARRPISGAGNFSLAGRMTPAGGQLTLTTAF